MTNEEKQEIIAAVLSSIRTNSKTISQLTAVNGMSNDDYMELNGGRKVSYAVLISALATTEQMNQAAAYLDGKKTDKDASGLVECHQSRVVYLDAMGSIDGVGQNVGDGGVFYDSNRKLIYDSEGAFGEPKQNAVYISKNNQLAYEWDGEDMVLIPDPVKSRQVIDYINEAVPFVDMAIGTMYYLVSSKKLAVKISESKSTSFEPNPNIIYYARDTGNKYIWNAGTKSWEQI